MKNLLALILFFSFGAFAEKEIPGNLIRLSSPSGKLSYECEINTRLKKARLTVTLDLDSRWMETSLAEGVVVKGYATETFDPQTSTTVYFVQGSTAPYSQQLALYIRDGGNWAQFKRTYGGEAFVCSQK